MAAINPYLVFDGNCEAAFNFYRSVFGGNFYQKTRFNELDDDVNVPYSEGQKIVHISLPIGPDTVLMGSDRPAAEGDGIPGQNFSVSINSDSEDEASWFFKRLSTGGEVALPFLKVCRDTWLGMLTDRFGIHWIISCEEHVAG
ncbi:VOC family protein [Chitinophaga agrisoli]|uniref:VOC family protein n=1 Tax=Chitinophaga agrisoli TaxID=2607653 RepID=A0A5B2VYI2_9BACT|nr:VOC family protein [Chitinophaga agrisoli]KAA2243247.1 VOC family protein [Chitinophaga agrisoli]